MGDDTVLIENKLKNWDSYKNALKITSNVHPSNLEPLNNSTAFVPWSGVENLIRQQPRDFPSQCLISTKSICPAWRNFSFNFRSSHENNIK